jgi:hypothetical protein
VGASTSREPWGLPQPVTGIALPLPSILRIIFSVGTVPASEGLTKQLFALVSKHEELLTGVLSLEDEAEDEPAAKKIPLLLIQGITQFTLQISCSDAYSKVSCSCMRCVLDVGCTS